MDARDAYLEHCSFEQSCVEVDAAGHTVVVNQRYCARGDERSLEHQIANEVKQIAYTDGKGEFYEWEWSQKLGDFRQKTFSGESVLFRTDYSILNLGLWPFGLTFRDLFAAGTDRLWKVIGDSPLKDATFVFTPEGKHSSWFLAFSLHPENLLMTRQLFFDRTLKRDGSDNSVDLFGSYYDLTSEAVVTDWRLIPGSPFAFPLKAVKNKHAVSSAATLLSVNETSFSHSVDVDSLVFGWSKTLIDPTTLLPTSGMSVDALTGQYKSQNSSPLPPRGVSLSQSERFLSSLLQLTSLHSDSRQESLAAVADTFGSASCGIQAIALAAVYAGVPASSLKDVASKSVPVEEVPVGLLMSLLDKLSIAYELVMPNSFSPEDGRAFICLFESALNEEVGHFVFCLPEKDRILCFDLRDEVFDVSLDDVRNARAIIALGDSSSFLSSSRIWMLIGLAALGLAVWMRGKRSAA